ncbi:Fc.00g059540.m01.CDS01 [Cosmosporella sp. VM-42]
MLNSRRAFVLAAFILTVIFLISRGHDSSSTTPAKVDDEAAKANVDSNGAPADEAPKPKPRSKRPRVDLSHMSTYDKLGYAYPYDVETKFPAYIWQTWKLTPADHDFNFREHEQSWSDQHPGFVHEVITDEVAVNLLKLLYAPIPEVMEAYMAMPLPVLKADFFRYLILFARGGIYTDIDTYAIKSALDWIPQQIPRETVGLVIGIEADPDRPDWADWYSRRIQFCQWTIQSKPGHPVLRDLIDRIVKQTLVFKRTGRLSHFMDRNVVEFTGPAIWTDTIMDYFNDQRYFDMRKSKGKIDYRAFTGMESSRRVGDVVVLPITSFSPGVGQMGAKEPDDPMAYVKHDFEGTWKPESERHMGEQPQEGQEGTIPQHFSSIVSAHGDRPAVIARSPTPQSVETTLTYHALDLLSNRLAGSLSSLGVRKGDRVAVSLGNSPDFAALTYAIFKLGAVLVPLNPGFNAKQVQAALRHLGVEVLIIGAVTDLAYRPGKGRSNEHLLDTIVEDLRASRVESEGVPTLKKVVVVDNRGNHPEVDFKLEECRALTPYETLLEGSDRVIKPDSSLDPSDTINIQFTSGTTSHPKAAMLTHTSILNNGAFIADRMGLVPEDLIVVPPPLFHCFGCVLGYMATATTGAAILFPSPAFDPVATLRMCADHDATGLYGVSTMLVAVLDALDNGVVDKAPSRLTKGIVAGSSVPESLMKKLYQKLGLGDLVICYGMTETSPVSIMTKPSDPFSKRTSSVGTVMPHTAVKIVDPHDRNKIVPLHERGELAAAGYLVMKGYYGDEERTAEVRIPDEEGTMWMYSGDEAEMDADGYVQITGRIKDLIIRGGENIHPLEVEDCILEHDGVREASVVGVPDERYGEAVAAFIIPARHWTTDASSGGRPGAHAGDGALGTLTRDEVREWVYTKLSKHLAPKYVFWVEEYPKTASGKIQKFKLRTMAKKWLDEGK